MKRLTIHIIISIHVAVIMYLIWSFVALEMNPAVWDKPTRATYTLFMILINATVNLIYADYRLNE